MESLPTEILQKILGDLPLHERLRVERVCKRWKSVSTDQVWKDLHVLYIITPYSVKKYHRFRDSAAKLGKFVTMEDNKLYIGADELKIIQSLVSRAGKHIKKLIFNFHTDEQLTNRILAIIAVHCHNIEVIQLLHVGDSEVEAFSKLLEVNNQLHSIACFEANAIIEILPLRDWKSLHIGLLSSDEDEWDTELVALVDNSPSLEKFHVDHWTPNLAAAISKCEQLETLYFPIWCEEAPDDLMMNTSLLNRLTCLKVMGPEDEDTLIVELLSRCINLKCLGLFYYYDEQLPLGVERVVMALPKLEFLDLNATSLTDKILCRLLKFKHLRIGGSSQSITEKGIFGVIKNSECLEKLEIPDIKITQNLFRRLVRNIGEHRKILTVEVSTGIYKEALRICEGSKIRVIEQLESFESRTENCRI